MTSVALDGQGPEIHTEITDLDSGRRRVDVSFTCCGELVATTCTVAPGDGQLHARVMQWVNGGGVSLMLVSSSGSVIACARHAHSRDCRRAPADPMAAVHLDAARLAAREAEQRAAEQRAVELERLIRGLAIPDE